MTSSSAAKHFDFAEHIHFGSVTGFVNPFSVPLLFQAVEETFRSRTISRIVTSANVGFLIVGLTGPHPRRSCDAMSVSWTNPTTRYFIAYQRIDSILTLLSGDPTLTSGFSGLPESQKHPRATWSNRHTVIALNWCRCSLMNRYFTRALLQIIKLSFLG